MKNTGPLWLAAVAIAALIAVVFLRPPGAAPGDMLLPEEPYYSETHLYASCEDRKATILNPEDDPDHDAAVIFAGDWLRFICEDCPDGSYFGVSEFHHLADLNQLADVEHKDILTNATEGSFGQAVERIRADPGRPTPLKGNPVSTKDVDWVPANEPIDFEAADVRGHHLWKFTWNFMCPNETTDRLDPHVYSHGGRRR